MKEQILNVLNDHKLNIDPPVEGIFEEDFEDVAKDLVELIEKQSHASPELSLFCACAAAKGYDHDGNGRMYCVECENFIKP